MGSHTIGMSVMEMGARTFGVWAVFLALGVLSAAGCHSPYHADRGALVGGLVGAGTGALVGEAVGNPLAGAAVGGGVGTLTGAAVGSSLDEIEARNRAAIESRLGRPVSSGAVTVSDVVSMSEAGVDEAIMVSHIESQGIAQSLETSDLIHLKQSGVSREVIQALQRSHPARGPVASRETLPPPSPPPVIIEEHHWDDPWHHGWHGPPGHWRHHHRHHHHSPRLSWGFSFSSDH